jgi:hypothetical protein
MANLIAQFYSWWNLYLRFYDEELHLESIRTRPMPMLMDGVGRQSGGLSVKLRLKKCGTCPPTRAG